MRVPVALSPYHPDFGPAWQSRYRCDWGQVVGRRVRLLRERDGLRLSDLADKLYRADGKPYSASFVSRVERGFASPPLWAYIHMASIFDLSPGRLLGPEDLEGSVTEPEMTLIRVVRRLGLEPEEAIARLVRPE
ncbi:MAG: helix-turn-helix transcriptional regulator [Thermoleophilaceae bacterium]